MAEKLRFYYNMNTCIGCGACQVACKDYNNLLEGEYIRKAGIGEIQDEKGKSIRFPFSFSCNHCEKPACMDACPTKAIYINEEQLVLHQDNLCIGCGRCFWACPYGEISLNKSRGTAMKCDTCIDRRNIGLEPACVLACPTKSLKLAEFVEGNWEKLQLPMLPDFAETEPATRIIKATVFREEKNED